MPQEHRYIGGDDSGKNSYGIIGLAIFLAMLRGAT
jgi:hypothetical protein